MCLNNTKELELCNSRRRKKMPDPPYSHSEFTRDRNIALGQSKVHLLVISQVHRGRTRKRNKRNLVFVCLYVCGPRCTHMCIRLSILIWMSEVHGGQRQQSLGAGKKNSNQLSGEFLHIWKGSELSWTSA